MEGGFYLLRGQVGRSDACRRLSHKSADRNHRHTHPQGKNPQAKVGRGTWVTAGTMCFPLSPYDLLFADVWGTCATSVSAGQAGADPGAGRADPRPSPTQATSEARAPHDQRGHPLHASRDGQEGRGRSVHRGRPRGHQGRRPGRARSLRSTGRPAHDGRPAPCSPRPPAAAPSPSPSSPPGFLNEQLFLLLQRLQAAQGPPQAASLEPGWGGCFLPTWVSIGVPRASCGRTAAALALFDPPGSTFPPRVPRLGCGEQGARPE